MPKDTRNPLPTEPLTPKSPYSGAQLRRSNRLRQNTNLPSGSSSSAGPSNRPEPSTPSVSRSQWTFPTPSTPNTPRVVRTYSRASKKKHGKRKREPSVDSVASASSALSNGSDELPTALEFLEQLRRSSAQPLDDAVVIKEFLASVESDGTCSICMLPMARPYITSCGHGWCADCLKITFQAQLTEKLSDFELVNHHFLNHTLVECQHVPTSDFEQHLLVRALRDHDCRIEELFSYTCPECRTLVKTEPTVNYPLLHMLETQRKSLKNRLPKVDASSSTLPLVIEKLEIRIRDANYPKPQGRRAIRRIIWRINFILQNIEARSSVCIDLEWMINAYPGWVTDYFVSSSIRLARVGSWSTLCQLTVNGHFSRLCNLTAALSQLRSLVVLKVSALWDDDNIPVGGYLSSQLRELEVSTTSLWSLKFEALDSPPNVDKVEIICQTDTSPLLPWDYEAFSLDLWYDSEGSESEESTEEDEELVGEDIANSVEDEVDVEGEESADGEGYEDDGHEDEEWEEEAADEEGYIEKEESVDDGYGDEYGYGYKSEEYDEEHEDEEHEDKGDEDGEGANRGLGIEDSNQESETVTAGSRDGIATDRLVAWFRSIGITVEDPPDVAVKATDENPLLGITL
ncbi:hypothetical protein MD484_g3221, partial [Candolleomyces efflorescens]